MKIIFVIILVLGILTGCSDDQYSAEKMLYYAAKASKKIYMSADAAAPFEYRAAVSAYERIVERFTNTAFEKTAQFKIGELYLLKKEYDTARRELGKLISRYPDDRDVIVKTKFAIAKTYEIEGRWDQALKEFEKIEQNYTDSIQAIQIPIYIAQYYQKQEEMKKAALAYQQAIEKYENIARDNQDTPKAYLANDLIAACLINQQRWEETVVQLKKIIESYPKIAGVLRSAAVLEQIYIQKLKQPQAVLDFYEKFISEHKDEDYELSKILRKRIEKIKEVTKT
ncbi:MAG: tetratricopeptide repeat protein [Candidatus Omnitrophota bacterium]